MIEVIHVSAECYPVAKAGGMGDVVGSLPKFLNGHGVRPLVVIPGYQKEWIANHQFESVYEGSAPLGSETFSFSIEREFENSLGFPLFVVDIPERFDRPGIYKDPYTGSAYWDELERFLSFQIAVLDWIRDRGSRPGLVHCHDHHAGLIPFMLTKCFRYRELGHIPTVLTIHNAEYQGIYDRSNHALIPSFDLDELGLLDWDGNLNCLAAGIKSCWKLTTVSPTYMEELSRRESRLRSLYQQEQQKSLGILNGIDTGEWNPETDPHLEKNYTTDNCAQGKKANKEALCSRFDLDSRNPLVAYVGRLAHEKGADLMPGLFSSILDRRNDVSFLVLGTGDPVLHERFYRMEEKYGDSFGASVEYDEALARQIYGGSDFIFMPSRVEPCGLTQLYGMRYGSIPIVREVGGLRDTVKDVQDEGGYGFTFYDFTEEAASGAINRGLERYGSEGEMNVLRKKVMELDFSWNVSAKRYITLYRELTEA